MALNIEESDLIQNDNNKIIFNNKFKKKIINNLKDFPQLSNFITILEDCLNSNEFEQISNRINVSFQKIIPEEMIEKIKLEIQNIFKKNDIDLKKDNNLNNNDLSHLSEKSSISQDDDDSDSSNSNEEENEEEIEEDEINKRLSTRNDLDEDDFDIKLIKNNILKKIKDEKEMNNLLISSEENFFENENIQNFFKDKNFILTSGSKRRLLLLKKFIELKINVILEGETGTSKTLSAEIICELLEEINKQNYEKKYNIIILLNLKRKLFINKEFQNFYYINFNYNIYIKYKIKKL